MAVDMKRGKNKGTDKESMDVDNKKEKPTEDKVLEERWNKFVKEARNPLNEELPKPPKPPEKESQKQHKNVEKELLKPSKPTEKKIGDEQISTYQKTKVKEVLETDVDKLYNLTRDKGILKVKDAAKSLGIDNEQVEEWARILEEHKLVRLRYPPVGDPVIILKRFTSDTEKIKTLKRTKKLRPRKRVFIINVIIILSFMVLISFYTIRFNTIRITYTQAYLAAAVIIIIGIIFVLRLVKKRGKNEKGIHEDKGKQAQEQRDN